MSNEHDRMAHHVAEHTAALQLTAPEPRLVRTAMFFGGPRQIRTPCGRNASFPDDVAADFDRRREELILEISVTQANPPHQFHDPLRLTDIPGERFLAGQAVQGPAAALDRTHDLFHVFDASVN